MARYVAPLITYHGALGFRARQRRRQGIIPAMTQHSRIRLTTLRSTLTIAAFRWAAFSPACRGGLRTEGCLPARARFLGPPRDLHRVR
eukprot:7439499-Pyramimonas_sp.AAC.1